MIDIHTKNSKHRKSPRKYDEAWFVWSPASRKKEAGSCMRMMAKKEKRIKQKQCLLAACILLCIMFRFCFSQISPPSDRRQRSTLRQQIIQTNTHPELIKIQLYSFEIIG